MAKLTAGQTAPDFTLPDKDNTQHALSDYRGQWVLLYFYPKDDTPGCTKEACAIRDAFPNFKKLSIVVLGVSVDSPERHTKFTAKYELPFTLLADEDKTVVRRYGVWGQKKFMGKTYQGTRRMSFLIDPNGRIAKVYATVKPAEHAEQVLRDVDTLRAGGST